MAVRLNITRKDKILDQETFLGLLDDFINDSYAGRRTKKNGARIKDSTIVNYLSLKKYLLEYVEGNSFQIKIYIRKTIKRFS